MMKLARVFIAGTIQGANRGLAVEDQGYRDVIPNMVRASFPDVECFDPSAVVRVRMADPGLSGVVAEIARSAPSAISTADLPPQIEDLRGVFHRMTREVQDCDLCIAYLPHRIPSMGTAMEMYAAYLAGVPVVAVTEMAENLAIVAVSDWILKDLDALRVWLSELESGAGFADRMAVQ
ncbi:hypothetical protein [Cryobacterium sp. TMT1-66-1]|uniref:hypothetical protein n=1 Tax=Cryobacterium sp. TMT1-66-1 TaxID=1259242 RepID=UPI00106AB0F5|nr:hypothetical protein [Cryobacterium sp. TMT1-66-1]TFD06325.1 hypothetical protein E3T29_10685 [Cryobacterium sp. TMT1-66-1]